MNAREAEAEAASRELEELRKRLAALEDHSDDETAAEVAKDLRRIVGELRRLREDLEKDEPGT